MSSSAPIGVFDSGLGGISVARQIAKDMPAEHVLYFGDSANAPYGIKTPEQVRALSFDIVERFVRQGVKAVVIACNTATSAAVNDLREHYDIPIIGMEPALKVACDRGDVPSDPHHIPQRVIVAATPLTLRERKFAKLMDRFDSNNTIFKEPCPDLVEIVESGRLGDHDLVMRTLHGYFDQYDMEHIDSVVLGCTHYPLLRSTMRRLMGEDVTLVNPAYETAIELRGLLAENGLSRDPFAPFAGEKHQFFVSDLAEKFTDFASSILPEDVTETKKINIEEY